MEIETLFPISFNKSRSRTERNEAYIQRKGIKGKTRGKSFKILISTEINLQPHHNADRSLTKRKKKPHLNTLYAASPTSFSSQCHRNLYVPIQTYHHSPSASCDFTTQVPSALTTKSQAAANPTTVTLKTEVNLAPPRL